MKNKKHIDELFKERFKDIETTPPPHVWDNIQAELQKKEKDRKVIPLWWKLGGVAALLALLFTIGNSVFNSEETNNEIVTEETTVPEHSNPEKNTSETIFNQTQVASETEDNATEENIIQTSKETQPSQKGNVENKSRSSKNKNKNASVLAVENTSEEQLHKTASEKVIKNNEQQKVNTDAVAIVDETEKNKSNLKEVLEKNNTDKTNAVIANERIISEKINAETATAKSEEEVKNEINKESIFDAIEDAKKAEEAVAKTNKPDNRWDVSPNVAPVYYSSLNGGSSIDPMFSDNSKSSDVNISYGVQVAYNITDRLSIRSGVNNVNLGYATSGLDIGTGPVAYGLRTVNYNGNDNVIIATDRGGLQMNSPGDGFGTITTKSTGGNAQIIQDISYYEVPLELKYAVVNNRFGINMIGGLSTLFLGNNEVSVEDGDFRSVLGEANNLNSVSFTTNVGVGFGYKISKRLKFNIEPMFKYQLNPYNDSSVSFKPYYLGLYSGLSFKF